jgi:hypothetical protein
MLERRGPLHISPRRPRLTAANPAPAQAPAAALLLRSLASQDAVALACDAARALRLAREPSQRQGSARGSAAGADATALVTTIWRFLGSLIRWAGRPVG